jgi:chromosome partitioning protein
MRIIALMNQKGGVAKTTTAVNLGAALAEAGKKVCLVDLDPQSHLTINCGLDPTAPGVSLYDVLLEGKPISDAVRKIGERTTLVPASIDLAAAEVELVNVPARQTLLKRRIEESAAAGKLKPDFMILDCPPSLGLLTLNGLAAAGEVIIPMQPHFLALQGVGKLLETVSLVGKQLNPLLRVSGIVLTMFDSQTKLSGEVVKDMREFLASAAQQRLPWSDAVIFQTRIRRNVKLAESPGFGQSILQYDSASHGAADYRSLAREVLALPAAAVEPVRQQPAAVRAAAARIGSAASGSAVA